MSFKINRRKFLGSSLAVTAGICAPSIIQAQSAWPRRPITVAMTSPAGGGTDRGVRPLCSLLEKALGAPRISLQDMSSAGGVQATDWVAGQPADGNAWLGTGDQIDTFALMGRYGYTYKDFDFWMAAGTPAGFMVRADSPFQTMEDLVQAIKEKPGELSCATTPTGTGFSILSRYISVTHDLDYRTANFKGGGPTVRALLAGETDFGVVGITPAAGFVKSGEIRVLAASVPEDWEVLGAVLPSIRKTFPDDEIMQDTLPWTNANGIALHPDTPQEIKKTIDEAFASIVDGPEMLQVYEDNAYYNFGMKNHEDSNALMRKRAAFAGYLLEDVTGLATVSRDELGIDKL